MRSASPEKNGLSPAATGQFSDCELIKRVKSGDPAAFRLLVDRHSAFVLSVAQTISVTSSGAEDITQQVFLKLWQRADQFDPKKSKFTTWLYRVTVNQALDEKRKRTLIPLPENYDQIDPSDNSEIRLAKIETTEDLKQAIAQLPEKQKMALTLTYFSELSNKEAASILNITVKALESHLVRGRHQLRRLMTSKNM